MGDTNFTAHVTTVTATWAQEVNDATFRGMATYTPLTGSPTTVQAKLRELERTSDRVVEPGLRLSLAEAVDLGGATPTLVASYVFGSGATPVGTEIPIRNLTDLAAHFNPFEDFAQTRTINAEAQRYQAFGASTHSFASDRLDLIGSLEGGGVLTSVVSEAVGTVNLDGTSTAIANLGLANTTGLVVGQLVMVQFKGIYRISALVVNTSVSLTSVAGSPTSAQTNNLIAWLPAYRDVLTSTAALGATTLAFTTALPTGVIVGMYIGVITSSSVGDMLGTHRVLTIAGDRLSCTTEALGEAINSGAVISFTPPIKCGQIWTQAQYGPVFGSKGVGEKFFAVEMECVLPYDSTGGYNLSGITTAAAYAAAPTDAPWGAWPALWMYSADTGELPPFTQSIAEIDVMEMFWSSTMGPRKWTGFNHGTLSSSVFYQASGSSGNTLGGQVINNWSASILTLNGPLSGTSSTVRTFGCVWVPGKTYKYIDGKLAWAALFHWSGGLPPQVGINLAVGSLLPAYCSNFTFPLASTNLTGMRLGIRRLKIYNL